MDTIIGGQCSIGFTLLQTIVGAVFGSLTFVLNMLVLGFLYRRYQSYIAKKQHGISE